MPEAPFIGRPLPRLEDLRLVRGAGRYTDDFSYPDQAYAAFVRSPHGHARIVRIEAAAARNAAGVLAVFTAADYLADGCGAVSHGVVPTDAVRPQDAAFHYTNNLRPLDEPHLPLALALINI